MSRRPVPGTPLGLRMAASCFLVGEVAPWAPATAASLVVLPAIYGFWMLPGAVQAGILVVFTWIAILVSTRAERAYGHDAKAIVIDEVAGMMVTFLFVPVPADSGIRLAMLGAGFLLFRVFDVLKPFPGGRAQNLPGGQGVVMDDVAAGVYANVLLRLGGLLL